jgi:uncharacterized protein
MLKLFQNIATKKILLCALCVFAVSVLFAQIPDRPKPQRLVNDFANVLNENEKAALEIKLVAYNDSTSTQVAIVTMQNLGGYDAASFSFELAEKWGIGRKSKNNGILILMSVEERDVFIATGYGVEEFVTDALAKRIVNNYLIPNFKQGNFYKGFDEATDVIIGLLTGQFKAEDLKVRRDLPPIEVIIFFIIIFIIIIFIGNRGDNGGGTYTGRGYRPHRSCPIIWGGSRGGSSWGGSSGGGFGGFGGGSFGGGGAGGKW